MTEILLIAYQTIEEKNMITKCSMINKVLLIAYQIILILYVNMSLETAEACQVSHVYTMLCIVCRGIDSWNPVMQLDELVTPLGVCQCHQTSSPGLLTLNSLAPGRSGCVSKNGIFNLVLLIDVFRSPHDNALRWMPQDLNDDKSTLVQVMAWCRQATSHYLSQCWPSSLSPYGVARPQWVDSSRLSNAYVHQQTNFITKFSLKKHVFVCKVSGVLFRHQCVKPEVCYIILCKLVYIYIYWCSTIFMSSDSLVKYVTKY